MEISEDYSCLLLIGPRQVGKTTMLEHLMEGTERQKVTLDDAENRRLAQNDPALFLEMHPAPILIDEVQYAPELFSYIKINVDNGAAPDGARPGVSGGENGYNPHVRVIAIGALWRRNYGTAFTHYHKTEREKSAPYQLHIHGDV